MTLSGRETRHDTDQMGASPLRRFAAAVRKSAEQPSAFNERARLLPVLFYNPKLKSSLLYSKDSLLNGHPVVPEWGPARTTLTTLSSPTTTGTTRNVRKGSA